MSKSNFTTIASGASCSMEVSQVRQKLKKAAQGGATTIEYVILASVIGIALIVAVSALGTDLGSLYTEITAAIKGIFE